METIISSIIAGLFALVALVLGELFLGRKLNEKLTEHAANEEMTNDKLLNEHSGLSKEHLEIKMIQNSIKERQSYILSGVNSINTIVSEEKQSQSLRYESLTDKQKDIKSQLQAIELLTKDWERQSLMVKNMEKEIFEIKERNIELAEENIDLKEQIRKTKNKNRNRDLER